MTRVTPESVLIGGDVGRRRMGAGGSGDGDGWLAAGGVGVGALIGRMVDWRLARCSGHRRDGWPGSQQWLQMRMTSDWLSSLKVRSPRPIVSIGNSGSDSSESHGRGVAVPGRRLMLTVSRRRSIPRSNMSRTRVRTMESVAVARGWRDIAIVGESSGRFWRVS